MGEHEKQRVDFQLDVMAVSRAEIEYWNTHVPPVVTAVAREILLQYHIDAHEFPGVSILPLRDHDESKESAFRFSPVITDTAVGPSIVGREISIEAIRHVALETLRATPADSVTIPEGKTALQIAAWHMNQAVLYAFVNGMLQDILRASEHHQRIEGEIFRHVFLSFYSE